MVRLGISALTALPVRLSIGIKNEISRQFGTNLKCKTSNHLYGMICPNNNNSKMATVVSQLSLLAVAVKVPEW